MRAVRDYPLDDQGAVGDGASRLARVRRALSTAIGATLALALLAALGIWFYRLGVRDAQDVPIIRASAEPTKTRPEEPGGVVAPYQEITSYSAPGDSPVSAPAAVLAPPPPEPRREDMAMGTLAPKPAERPDKPNAATNQPGGAGEAGDETDLAAERPAAALPEAVAATAREAEAEEIAALVRQATLDAATTPKPEPAAAFAAADPVPGASGFAPPRSPVAPKRPSDLISRVHASVRLAEQSASERARLAAESSIQIQLAADQDEQVVRAIWRRISQANSDILHDRALAVQSTESGGRTYYRLRVGPFAAMSEARAVCQALKARGQDCLVARNS